jgi:hypothetical protein
MFRMNAETAAMLQSVGYFAALAGRCSAMCAGLLVSAGIVLVGTEFAAIAQSSSPAGEQPTAPGGCWSGGRWHPEGARITPDPRSRIMASGVFVCRKGQWVFEPKQ